jgi:hypothetical protein
MGMGNSPNKYDSPCTLELKVEQLRKDLPGDAELLRYLLKKIVKRSAWQDLAVANATCELAQILFLEKDRDPVSVAKTNRAKIIAQTRGKPIYEYYTDALKAIELKMPEHPVFSETTSIHLFYRVFSNGSYGEPINKKDTPIGTVIVYL